MATIIGCDPLSPGNRVEEVEEAGEAYSDRFGAFQLDALAGGEPGDRTEHREAMISVRRHSPTLGAGGNPPHPEAIVTRLGPDAKGLERTCHAFDPIRLFCAQLLC